MAPVNGVTDELRALPAELPPPGSGETVERFRSLWSIASRSPLLARLAEAHFDAIAILHEAGRRPPIGALLGVWAAGGPDPARLIRADGGCRVVGQKHWCSGASLVTHALVTVEDPPTNALVLLELDAPGVRLGAAGWQSPAFAALDTRSVELDCELDPEAIVAGDDWYLTRPGFWHGAIGVAACWAGCVDGLVGRLLADWRDEPHALAHLGSIDASLSAIRAALDDARHAIDRHPGEPAEDRRRRALQVRAIVDLHVGDITDRVGRALGPAPFAFRPDLHLTVAEIDLYRRQCHAERDLEQLGRLVAGRGRPAVDTAGTGG